MANGWEKVQAELEELEELRRAYELLTEKDLLILIYRESRRPRPIIDLKPRQTAVALVSLLLSVGAVSAGAATFAEHFLGGF